MNEPATITRSCRGSVLDNGPVSRGLLRLDLRLEVPVNFLPGQFAMLNRSGGRAFVFGRPFSILAVDGDTVSFLYRVVGRGTAVLAELEPGDELTFLGPLGRPFPGPDVVRPALLVGGGVGLPPVAAWLARWGRDGDVACFGGRDGHDVPWDLLGSDWAVSVDETEGVPADHTAWHGLVTELAADRLAHAEGPGTVLACGPVPLLRAAADLAAREDWDCWLSLEEHMGCGYGVCKGCVVPVRDPAVSPWRNATCCSEGPVFPAADIVWEVYGAQASLAVTEPERPPKEKP
ncbi:MAG: hypothetical protein GY838_18960 [bacterium]|nr:hypothetical protein [bacterium]